MKISDRRKSHFFIVDNHLFDVWGKQLKPQGIAVYCCLIRHASNNSCFPSHQKIADECGISRRTVVSTIQKLSKLGLITTKKRTKETGGKASSLYIINDLPNTRCAGDAHCDVQEMHIRCAGDAHTHVQEMHIKKTKIEEDTFKKTTDKTVVQAKDSQKTSQSSSINLNKKENLFDGVVFPKGFRKTQAVLKELNKLPNPKTVQQVLDTYNAKRDEVKSPVGYIRGIVKNYLADDFTPLDEPGLADNIAFTPITEEKPNCGLCGNSGVLWIKDSTGCTKRAKCNHDSEKIIANLQKDKAYIEDTMYDFRTKANSKPSLSLKEQLQTKRKLEGIIGGFNNPNNLPPVKEGHGGGFNIPKK